ncbi:MAG: 1-deoxy-D-xylulose-5-phosphate reductoisomerase [Oscillospiraceae bacterium]|jgi:1-deoxy-D-xylulose-5-phosphate reductoisomerase|nr:1-deoxy-D-xylulose-5-phosphate reductoisomerase [Oscillospiraceae bacterium]
MKTVSVLGSTGSVGTQSLDVIRSLGYKVAALAAGRNITLLEQQSREFLPTVVSCLPDHYHDLKTRLADTTIKVTADLTEAASLKADVTLNAVSGFSGLMPSLAAIEAGNTLALANKETLVAAGDIVMQRAKDKNIKIIPVDSEHSAIFQCLQNNNRVYKVILTASGGAFYGFTGEQLCQVTPLQATRHPNWNMGKRITVDSATLMNKGLEFIEAQKLFGLTAEQIEIVIQRQSIVHSAVEYLDGAVIAQLGTPDMKLPVRYALTYPDRAPTDSARLSLTQIGTLTFEKPTLSDYPCLEAALYAASRGGNLPAALNGADEAAVSLFLNEQIKFTDIARLVREVLDRTRYIAQPTLDDIIETDKAARRLCKERF